MTAEQSLQMLLDFYPDLFPTRKHALNHLFCVIGNGYEWKHGELTRGPDPIMDRYKINAPIKKAVGRHEDFWWRQYNLEQACLELCPTIPRRYNFNWYKLSTNFSALLNPPPDIKPGWKKLLDECKELLIQDGFEIPDKEENPCSEPNSPALVTKAESRLLPFPTTSIQTEKPQNSPSVKPQSTT